MFFPSGTPAVLFVLLGSADPQPWPASRLAPFNLPAGTRSLYVVAKPESASLMDGLAAWPRYLQVLILILPGIFPPFVRLRRV